MPSNRRLYLAFAMQALVDLCSGGSIWGKCLEREYVQCEAVTLTKFCPDTTFPATRGVAGAQRAPMAIGPQTRDRGSRPRTGQVPSNLNPQATSLPVCRLCSESTCCPLGAWQCSCPRTAKEPSRYESDRLRDSALDFIAGGQLHSCVVVGPHCSPHATCLKV